LECKQKLDRNNLARQCWANVCITSTVVGLVLTIRFGFAIHEAKKKTRPTSQSHAASMIPCIRLADGWAIDKEEQTAADIAKKSSSANSRPAPGPAEQKKERGYLECGFISFISNSWSSSTIIYAGYLQQQQYGTYMYRYRRKTRTTDRKKSNKIAEIANANAINSLSGAERPLS
jgi:hypothetical protein